MSSYGAVDADKRIGSWEDSKTSAWDFDVEDVSSSLLFCTEP